MPASHYGQSSLPYAEFKRRIRTYPRNQLLRRAAELSAALEHARRDGAPPGPAALQPFALATVARAALFSNDHRGDHVTNADVLRLCSAVINVDDPAIVDGVLTDADAVNRLLARTVYEQFPSQYSPMENIGRSIPLMLDHADGVPDAPSDDEWRSVLGVTLEQYMRIGFAAFTAAVENPGGIARELMTADHVAPVWGDVPADEAVAVLDRHYVEQPDRLRAMASAAEVDGYERWSFNPLVSRPIVALAGDLVAPAAHLIADKFTTTGLYYTGVEAWGDRFAGALGAMFESYVGTQLRLVEAAATHPEVVWGSPERRSCDWFWVFDEVVVLVEVKSARPSLGIRIGDDDGTGRELESKVVRAAEQIATSARLVRDRHAGFEHIPADRPMVGLVLTLEPFHLRQTRQLHLLEQGELPVALACAHDLEGVVGGLRHAREPGTEVLAALNRAEPYERDLRNAAAGHNNPNPILQNAWDRWGNWEEQPPG